MASIWEQLTKWNQILMFLVKICIPHSREMMQIRRPATDCAFVACSVVGNETRKVSHTERVSTAESENKLAIHEGCPISVGKFSGQIRYLDELKDCSNCTEDHVESSIWSLEKFRYEASISQGRAAWGSFGKIFGSNFASKCVKTVWWDANGKLMVNKRHSGTVMTSASKRESYYVNRSVIGIANEKQPAPLLRSIATLSRITITETIGKRKPRKKQEWISKFHAVSKQVWTVVFITYMNHNQIWRQSFENKIRLLIREEHLVTIAKKTKILFEDVKILLQSGPFAVLGQSHLGLNSVQGRHFVLNCQNLFVSVGRKIRNKVSQDTLKVRISHDTCSNGFCFVLGFAKSCPKTARFGATHSNTTSTKANSGKGS